MVYFLTTGSPQGLVLYLSKAKEANSQISSNISYMYNWKSILKNCLFYLIIIFCLSINLDSVCSIQQ